MSIFIIAGVLLVIIMISLGTLWIFNGIDKLDKNTLNMEKYEDWNDESISIIITTIVFCIVLFGIGIAIFFIVLEEMNKI